MNAGDGAARRRMHTLYADHHGWLYNWLHRKLDNAFDAADLTQDTFARVLVSRQVEQIRQPRAYLTVVARGLLINWYQRQALERAYLEALARLPQEQAPAAEQSLVILETLHEIDALLDALPRRRRQVFLLSQLEGLTYQAIAERLGVSLITVKRDMKQAFARCLRLMDN